MEIEDIQGLLIIVAIVLVIFFGALSFDKSQTRQSCQNFGAISNRETKYVEYTYFNYTCITPDTNGKWIDTSMLRSIN